VAYRIIRSSHDAMQTNPEGTKILIKISKKVLGSGVAAILMVILGIVYLSPLADSPVGNNVLWGLSMICFFFQSFMLISIFNIPKREAKVTY